MEKQQIGIAIPTYHREDMLFESFAQVYDDPRIGNITIVDDASSLDVFNRIQEKCSELPKVTLHRNITNQDCYRNKYTAISLCPLEWNILLDSDNIIDKSYIDILYAIPRWHKGTILAPVFAKPHFDYREFSGELIDKSNVAAFMDRPMFSTALNTCNYFVNRDAYQSVWDPNIDPVTADSIYFAYCWMENNNDIHFVGGLEYIHRVHDGSHYKNNIHKTGNIYNEIESKIRLLR